MMKNKSARRRTFGSRFLRFGLLLGVLSGASPAFCQSLTAPVAIPEREPTEEIHIFCGTGRLSAADYQRGWQEWRGEALSARARGNDLCEGYALSRLAAVAERRYFSGISREYILRGYHLLQSELPEKDIRWIPFLQQYVSAVEPELKPSIYRRIISLLESVRSTDALPPSLGCGDSALYESLAKARVESEIALLTAWSSLGITLVEVGDVGMAAAALERVLDLMEAARWNPSEQSDPPYQVVAAVGSAVRSLATLTKKSPEAVPISLLERGIDLLSEIDESFALVDALEDLASIRGASGDTQAEEEVLRRALGVAEGTPLAFSSAVRKLVEFVEDQGRLEEAEALLLSLRDRLADGNSGTLELEGFYLRNRRWGDLRAMLEARLVEDPEDWSTLSQLGVLENQEGNWLRAADLLKRSLRALEAHDLAPENTNVSSILMNLGLAFRHSGREPAAQRAYERAFKIQEAARHKMREQKRPEKPWMFSGSVIAALGSKDLEDARNLLQQMEKSLALQTEHQREYETRVMTLRARLAAVEGRKDQAVAELQQAADLFRDLRAGQQRALKYDLLHLARACLELDLEVSCWSL